MSTFHPNFPFGKGFWIWELKHCLGGNVDAIIQKCKDFHISYVIWKVGDGSHTWDFQFNADIVNKFHAAGIKFYSWSYVYGLDPASKEDMSQREADIAVWALDKGVDGHVFDAESEFEHTPNPGQLATKMLQSVRARKPDAFLAHAPFPIIDYHTKFPYLEFGKYCDAVMPQIYWADWKPKTPGQSVQWTYEQWEKWEKQWKAGGFADSVKPIIPIGSTFDNGSNAYVLSPADIKEFIDAVRGYKSVNFWDFQHMLRDDCWEAMRDTNVDAPPADAVPAPQPQPVVQAQEQPVPPPTPQIEANSPPPQSAPVVVPTPDPVPVPEVPVVPAQGGPEEAEIPVIPVIITPNESTPVEANLNDSPAKVELPKEGSVSIHIKDGTAQVTYHKTHLEYFLQFVNYLVHLLLGVKK